MNAVRRTWIDAQRAEHALGIIDWSAVELAAEAAEAAAVAAAQLAADEGRVEEVVERPDGSEPDAPVAEVVVDPEAAVEVDEDDDPA